MNASVCERRPHAAIDLSSRDRKAIKIDRLLGLDTSAGSFRLLEVGCGSGGISHYFGTHPAGRYEVDAVDVHDSRVVHDGYRFTQVEDTSLPFADATFDVVISNHVIEHVGDASAQARHLAEIRRVMKPGGIGYLAVPNRWMLVEPHYKLAFLSWWPHAWRTPYLRMMRKGNFYDCEPLQMRQLECMLTAAGFCHRNLCVQALREMLDIERSASLAARIIRMVPDSLLKPLRRIIPTLIYRLQR